jgi:hypothetical protein
MATYNVQVIDGLIPPALSRVYEVSGGSPSGGASPGIASVVVIDETHIRINFDDPAVDNAALRSRANYGIDNGLEVLSVTPEAVAEPTYVDLEISEQVTGVLYTVGFVQIERAP